MVLVYLNPSHKKDCQNKFLQTHKLNIKKHIGKYHQKNVEKNVEKSCYENLAEKVVGKSCHNKW